LRKEESDLKSKIASFELEIQRLGKKLMQVEERMKF
jgi:hypothetical protein